MLLHHTLAKCAPLLQAFKGATVKGGATQRPGAWRTLYFRSSLDMPRCCCSRILTTSKGVTMTRASVMPAAKPAPMRRTSDSLPSWRQPSPHQPALTSRLVPELQHIACHFRCNLPNAWPLLSPRNLPLGLKEVVNQLPPLSCAYTDVNHAAHACIE